MAKRKLENVLVAAGLVVIVLLLSMFGSLLILIIASNKLSVDMLFLSTRVCLLLAFLIVFYLYYCIYRENFLRSSKFKQKSPLNALLIFFTFFVSFIVLIHVIDKYPREQLYTLLSIFLITSIAEELLFRGLVEFHLKKEFDFVWVIIIQACLFAFLGHQSFDFFSNLFIRLPLGIGLSLIHRYTHLYSSCIVVHFVYDTVMFALSK